MSKQSVFCETYPGTHPKTRKFFPGFDYKNPAGDRSVLCDMRNPGNQVGEQQRAFQVWWALETCGPLDLGLDIGSCKGLTPFCSHVDLYGMGGAHPFSPEGYGYGSDYKSDVVWDARRIHEIVPQASLPFISSNHSLEHMGDDIVELLVRWIGRLRHNGILALVVPDNAHFDVLASDRDHKHAWSAASFKRDVLARILTRCEVELVEFDTFNNNHFSFNIVLRKL
jgi:hypothetical protein